MMNADRRGREFTLVPDMARILAQRIPSDSMSVSEMRSHAVADKTRWNVSATEGLVVSDNIVPTQHGPRPARCVAPRPARNRPILYLHGGGWTICDLDTHLSIFAALARASGREVIALHARRAPEASYPAALDDTIAAIRHVATTHQSGFFLGGDSAGANLALGAVMRMRDEGEVPPVAAIIAFYGCFRRRFDTESYKRFGDGSFGLSSEKMRRFWDLYCGADDAGPYADLSDGDLSGLPPVQAHAAQVDPLHDDTIWLHKSITEAGGNCDLKIWHGVTHGFLHYASELPTARDAMAAAADFMTEKR